MNPYLSAFVNLGAQRDQALLMVAGLALTAVLAYGMLNLYRRLGIANDYVTHLGRFGIIATIVLLYLCSWFVG